MTEKTLRFLFEANNILIVKGERSNKIYTDKYPAMFYLVLSIPIMGNILSLIFFIISLSDSRQINQDKENILFSTEGNKK